MKTLDAHSLHVGIHELLRKLSDVKAQMDQVQRAVQEIAALEDSLMGKGGTAIRSFFEECHEPFLQVFASFASDYEMVLRNIKNALQSLDSAHNALISQSFLENDLKNGLKKAKSVSVELTNEANDTMERISDIVSLPRLNDAEFLNETEQAERQADRTIDRLIEFDVSQANALETIEEQVLTMKQYIQTIEQLFQGGRLSVTGYEPGLLWGKKESSEEIGKKTPVKKPFDIRDIQFWDDPSVRIDLLAPIGSIGNTFGTYSETRAYLKTRHNTNYRGYGIEVSDKSIKVKNGIVENIKGKKYDKTWITSQLKRGNTPAIANKVNVFPALKSTMKSRVGWLGVGVTTTENAMENIKNGESKSKIIGDAGVDIAIGGASLATGALVVSSVVASGGTVLIAAGIGLALSSTITYAFEGIKVGDSDDSLSDKIKNKVQSFADWF